MLSFKVIGNQNVIMANYLHLHILSMPDTLFILYQLNSSKIKDIGVCINSVTYTLISISNNLCPLQYSHVKIEILHLEYRLFSEIAKSGNQFGLYIFVLQKLFLFEPFSFASSLQDNQSLGQLY